jgi:hypothetical protein
MAVTAKQKKIAEQLIASLKDIDPEVIRQHIREENEYCRRQEEAQRPTREQMQREYDI